MWCLGLLMILVGFTGMIGLHKHVMNMLINLEFMMLGVIFLLINNISSNLSEEYILLILFVFAACEGVLGLSILVMLIRTHGSDYFLTMNITQC